MVLVGLKGSRIGWLVLPFCSRQYLLSCMSFCGLFLLVSSLVSSIATSSLSLLLIPLFSLIGLYWEDSVVHAVRDNTNGNGSGNGESSLLHRHGHGKGAPGAMPAAAAAVNHLN